MRVLVTGAGTGFGYEVALRLAKRGLDVIAGVEVVAQVHSLEQDAKRRGVSDRLWTAQRLIYLFLGPASAQGFPMLCRTNLWE